MVAINQENLLGQLIPDVYISKITLVSEGTTLTEDDPHIDHERENIAPNINETDSMTVTVDLLMKEKLDNSLIGTWFSNQDLTKYLNIKLYQSTDPKVTALLSAARDLLDLVDNKKNVSDLDPRLSLAAVLLNTDDSERIFNRLNRQVKSRTISAQQDTPGRELDITQFKQTVDSDGNRIFEIPFREKFELATSKPEHLAYFAVTSLDVEALSADFDISFNQAGLEEVNGKVASDLVIDDYRIVNRTFVFVDRQGKIWTGPIHRLPNGQFRTGANETPESQNLSRFPVSNTKIQDFRDVKEIERLTLDFRSIDRNLVQKNPTKILSNDPIRNSNSAFSQLLLTRDKDCDSKFFFSIDFDRLIEENTVFNELMSGFDNRMKMKIAESMQIRQMKVFRKRVLKSGGLSRIGTEKGFKNFNVEEPWELVAVSGEKEWKNFKNVSMKTGTLKEVEISLEEQSPLVRFFTGMDLGMSEVTDGYYQYIVEIEVDDGSVEFMQGKIKDLLAAKSVLEKYYNEASRPALSKYLSEVRDPHIDHPSEFAKTKGVITGAYDPVANRFTQNFTQEQINRYKSRRARNRAPWIAPIAVYADTLKLFTGAFGTRLQQDRLITSLYSYVSPKTGNPNGILTVMRLIDSLVSSILKLSGIEKVSNPRKFDGISSSTLQSPILSFGKTQKRTFKVQRTFDEIFDSNVSKDSGIDYLSRGGDDTQNTDGIKEIPSTRLIDRANDEINKFFNAPEPNIDISFGSNQITQNDSIKTTSLAFFSPSRIDLGNESVILSKASTDVTAETATKTKTSRFISRIDDSKLTEEDVATEVVTSMFRSVISNSPTPPFSSTRFKTNITQTTTTSFNSTANNIQLAQNSIAKNLGGVFEDKASIIINPIKLEPPVVVPPGGQQVFQPFPPELKPDVPLECPPPEAEADEIMSSLQAQTFSEPASVNQFLLSMAIPLIADGFDTKIAKISNRLSSPLQTFNVTNLQVNNTGTQKTISGLQSVVTEEELKLLPNQLKLLLLNGAQFVNKKGSTATGAVAKSASQSQNILDYELLGKVEYFAGFMKNEDGETLVREPIWKLLTVERNNELVGKNLLCRLLPYENTKLGIRPRVGLRMPIYDQYFLVTPTLRRLQAPSAPEPQVSDIEISSLILDEIRAAFPSVIVTRVPIPRPINELNEDDRITDIPDVIRVVEILPDGISRELEIALEGTDSPLDLLDDPDVAVDVLRDRSVKVEPTIATDLITTDIVSNEVSEEFFSNNIIPEVTLLKEFERVLTTQIAVDENQLQTNIDTSNLTKTTSIFTKSRI